MLDDNSGICQMTEETILFGVGTEASTPNCYFSSYSTHRSNTSHACDVELDYDAWGCSASAEVRCIIRDVNENGEHVVFGTVCRGSADASECCQIELQEHT